jgi:DNA-directed RNA polymerase subunit RPC12/RpoP
MGVESIDAQTDEAQTMDCPQCGTTMNYDTTAALYRCPNCLHRINAPRETLEQAAARLQAATRAAPPPPMTYRGRLEARTRTLYEEGHQARNRGDSGAAIRAFRAALELQHDFTDAHLWIAQLSSDPDVQKQHLDYALAYDPGSAEALRLRMVLSGRLTPEQAQRTRSDETPAAQRVDQPVGTTAQTLACPICGGRLTADAAARVVTCAFCGHRAPLDAAIDPQRSDSLGMALLEQRAAPVKWIVGKRTLRCHNCGAERTLARGDRDMQAMAGRCRFCGSTQVVLQDALGTLRQPSALLPLRVNEASAKDAVRTRLQGVSEKLISGVLPHNRVERAALEPIYAPFWVFDALLRVSQTRIDQRTPHSYAERDTMRPYEQIEYTDSLLGICVPAVKALPAELVSALDEFQLGDAVPYEPRLLTDIPAALYDVDFDHAAMQARSIASTTMRERYSAPASSQVTVNTYTFVVQMTFSLLLLPLWIASLVERDGDVRTALIHGQTGGIVMGRGVKSEVTG